MRGAPLSKRLGVAAALVLAVALTGAACGDKGSSGTKAPENVAGKGCDPVAGEQLVELTDDEGLQNADNVVPAINKAAASAPLVAALDKVSKALDTQKLIALNKAVDVDRKSAKDAATEFANAQQITQGLTRGSGNIVIGAGNFSEAQVLAYLYEIALDAAGFNASVKTLDANREVYEPALERGELQVFPEYAATMAEFLNKKVNGANPTPVASNDVQKTMTALRDLGNRVGLVFGEASAAADQNAFAVTKAFADKNSVRTLSEFAAKCSGKASILGGPPECPTRPFCQVGLKDKYGIEFGKFEQLDAGGPQTITALRTGKITVGLLFTTAPVLAR